MATQSPLRASTPPTDVPYRVAHVHAHPLWRPPPGTAPPPQSGRVSSPNPERLRAQPPHQRGLTGREETGAGGARGAGHVPRRHTGGARLGGRRDARRRRVNRTSRRELRELGGRWRRPGAPAPHGAQPARARPPHPGPWRPGLACWMRYRSSRARRTHVARHPDVTCGRAVGGGARRRPAVERSARGPLFSRFYIHCKKIRLVTSNVLCNEGSHS